jgi:CheY-like chemotaxis protein
LVKLALIVDDSKSARLLLRKKLQRHHIPVEMVESGEETLEYLKTNTPDVIFMDHMMPGMDGFAAVKAIKSNPLKSFIPIIMHTTKQGDIYVGQARALGAMAILPKPASDQDLVLVLNQVKVATEQNGTVTGSIEALSSASKVDINSLSNTSISSALPPSSADSAILVDRSSSTLVLENDQPPFLGTFRQWMVAVIWLLPSLWLLNLYFTQQQALQVSEQRQAAFVKSIEWLLNQRQSYDYGELPMAGERLEMLEALLPKLKQSGFKGVIRLEGHTGDFCLSQVVAADGSEVLMLPDPALPMTACDLIGFSKSKAQALSIGQSPAFLNFQQSLKLQDANIRVELAAYGDSTPRLPYPNSIEGVTTGDWNAIALDNNRILYVLISE